MTTPRRRPDFADVTRWFGYVLFVGAIVFSLVNVVDDPNDDKKWVALIVFVLAAGIFLGLVRSVTAWEHEARKEKR